MLTSVISIIQNFYCNRHVPTSFFQMPNELHFITISFHYSGSYTLYKSVLSTHFFYYLNSNHNYSKSSMKSDSFFYYLALLESNPILLIDDVMMVMMMMLYIAAMAREDIFKYKHIWLYIFKYKQISPLLDTKLNLPRILNSKSCGC